jgi:hypothetical protein
LNSTRSLKLKQEALWLGIIMLLCLIVLIPIKTNQIEFPFLGYNMIYIAVFIVFSRMIFLLRHSFLSHAFVIKLILIFISIPIIVLLMDGLAEFQAFMDEDSLHSLMMHLPLKTQNALARFIRSEFIFFGVGSVLTAIILPIRLIVSIWRVRNRGTV